VAPFGHFCGGNYNSDHNMSVIVLLLLQYYYTNETLAERLEIACHAALLNLLIEPYPESSLNEPSEV